MPAYAPEAIGQMAARLHDEQQQEDACIDTHQRLEALASRLSDWMASQEPTGDE